MSMHSIWSSDGEAQDQIALSTQGPEAGRFLMNLTQDLGTRGNVPFLQWQAPTAEVFDWPWNDDVACLLSTRARSVIEPLLGPDDHVQWLPASLLTLAGESLPYWIAHFYEPVDVYHDGLTESTPSGIPFRWTLSLGKAAGHQVFVPPHRGNMVIVSDLVAAALRTAGLTGTTLTPCPEAW